MESKNKAEAFVDFVISRLNAPNANSAFGATLRRADNPQTEYQSWEYLTKWCDITNAREQKAYTTIAAALARAKPQSNGKNGIGRALALCYSDEGHYNGSEKDAAISKMRRLLACESSMEACAILRPLLNLIASKSANANLDYALLLKQVLYSDAGFTEWVKPRWAQDFYHTDTEGRAQ
jgi:CRISPR system Cascade subunit CasB